MSDTTFLAYDGSDPVRMLGDRLLGPDTLGYDDGRRAWNLSTRQRPAAVVMAESAADVAAAVRLAVEQGRGVGVMATGHGTVAPVDDGILVNTSRMREVEIDPLTRVARVAAGARWADLGPLAAAHGLTGLPGSASGVGVVGYSQGGGFGWLGRRFGFAGDAIRSARMVTACGELVTVSPTEHRDLFAALGAAGGNFGVVTSLDIQLHPLTHVYGGNLYYPVERARPVLEFFASWSGDLPEAMMAAATFRSFPPLPTVPERLRGRSFVAVRGCWSGEDLEAGRALVAEARAALGPAAVDTFAEMPVTALDAISMDPVDPIGARLHSETLGDLSPEAIDALLEVAGPAARSPLVMLEVRRLGGALQPRPDRISPVGRPGVRFTVNAVGVTPSPAADAAVRAHLERVARALAPVAAGATYVNFLDLGNATPERIRAAYGDEDWARLVALKDRWDPHNRFRFNRNIPPSAALAVA